MYRSSEGWQRPCQVKHSCQRWSCDKSTESTMNQQVNLVLCWVNEVFGKKIHRQTTIEQLSGNVMQFDVFHWSDTNNPRIEGTTFSIFRCTRNHREKCSTRSPQSLFLLKVCFNLLVLSTSWNYRGWANEIKIDKHIQTHSLQLAKEKTNQRVMLQTKKYINVNNI